MACSKLSPLVSPLVEQRWVAGASVALVRSEQVELCSFGDASKPSGYSNLGAALLGLALAQRSGKPYGALLEERVLRPLQMTHTYLRVPDAEPREFERVDERGTALQLVQGGARQRGMRR